MKLLMLYTTGIFQSKFVKLKRPRGARHALGTTLRNFDILLIY